MRIKRLANLGLLIGMLCGLAAISHAQTCSASAANKVGDQITVAGYLTTTDPNENGEGEPLLISSSGGEFSAVVNNYFINTTFVYTATAANEVITGTNVGFDGDESCSVTATISKSPLLTPGQKSFFAGLAAGLGIPAAGFSTVGGLCTAAIITGPICGLPGVILGGVFTGGAALSAVIALDPSDPNFMQIVVVVIPTIPPAGPATGVPQTVIDAWNAVQENGAQVIGYEEALLTTLNRAAGANSAGNTFWLNQQLAEASILEGQLAPWLSRLASSLMTLQTALQVAGINVQLTSSQVLNFETQVVSSGIPPAELSFLQSIDNDPTFLTNAADLLLVQDINAVAGSVANLLAPPSLITLLNSFSQNTSDSLFQVRYAANLNIGESYINITNTGANGAALLGPGFGTQSGNICVNVYAFDPGEELISCCSCLVTPDQTVNLGVNRDLTVKTLTGVVPTSVTVKLLSSLAGGDGTGTSCTNSAASVTSANLAGGLAAWGTTLHANPVGGYDSTEAPFTPSTLSQGELASIGGRCSAILGNGSGFGICNSCRAGAFGASHLSN